MNGTIVMWDSENGSGAIRDGSGDLRTFSKSDLVEDQAASVGADVRFTPAETELGLCATMVRAVPAETASGSVVISDVRIPFLSVLVLVIQFGICIGVFYATAVAVIVGIQMF